MKCAACRKTITGSYVKSGKKVYHPEHFICAFCSKPIGAGSILHEKKNYHKECFFNNIASKCTLCSKVITGRYLKDFWGNIYHSEHSGKVLQCRYCDRFVSERLTGGCRKYKDGRIVCNLCLASVVTEIGAAENKLDDVCSLLEKRGIKIEYKGLKLFLIDNYRLKKISESRYKGRGEQTGFTYYKKRIVNNRITQFKIDIYILTGLPEMHFIMTAAHELMHVWQYMNVPLKNNSALCEGSCNFAASLVLKTLKNKESDYLIHNMRNNRDRAYGTGFKRVSVFVKRVGIKEWLDYLKKNKNFPLWY